MARTGLAKSKGAARRTLQQGGVYVNNRRVGEDRPVTSDDLGTESMLVLRMGKKDCHIIRVG